MLSRNNIELTTSKGYEFMLEELLPTLLAAAQKQRLDLSAHTPYWTYSDINGTEVCFKYTTL